MSVSTENFVKAIYILQQAPEGDSRPGNLARTLGISNAAATDMARKLAQKQLVNYVRYKALSLTPAGNQMALKVIRKHRLWETFLYQTLELSLHEIHREAESLEHATSDALAEKISGYLDHPSMDPHGDPIPDAEGNIIPDENQISLFNALPEQSYMISRLFSSDKEFFEFCGLNGIQPGAPLMVVRQYSGQSMTEIDIDNRKLLIHKNFSQYIYVQSL